MIRKISTMFVAIALLVAGMTVTVNAQITVDTVAFWNSTSKPITGFFDASGFDKLVVIVTGEHGFPNNIGGNCAGVTYDGVELTQAVDRNPILITEDPYLVDQTYNDIWYLDNPGTSTGEIIADVQTRGNVTVFGLLGTAPGVGATAISPMDSKSVDLTTTAPDSIVIVSHGMGGQGNTANVNSVDAVAPLIETSAQENGNIWDGHVTGYAIVESAGPGTYEFTGGNLVGSHTIAAEFLSAAGPAQAGDFNGDGAVEAADLALLLGNWGGTTQPGDWTTNWDDFVDANELADLLGNWGAGLDSVPVLDAAALSAIPEPATMTLLALSGLAALRRRRA